MVGGSQTVGGAEGLRDAARCPQLGRLPDGKRRGALEERGVYVLPAPGLLAGDVGGEDAEGAEQPRREVADGYAALGGSSVRLAGNAHHPGHSLRDQVVAGTHGVRTGLPEAGDAGVDNARVYLPKCFVVHAELLRNLGTIVLDDHVRLAGEAVEDLTRLVLLEIERHALLVAVYGDEGGGVLALLHPEAHGPPALLPGLRGLNLGDHSSHVRENLAAERTGHHLREVQNLQLLKWQHRDSNPPSSGGLCVRLRISTAPSRVPFSGSAALEVHWAGICRRTPVHQHTSLRDC